MHSSRGHIQSSHKLNALKSENLSLMAEIASELHQAPY